MKGKLTRSYPLSWTEQNGLIKGRPRHLADPVLFGINTGGAGDLTAPRDREVEIPELETSVFILP